MGERRLRIFLLILVIVAFALAARAFQIQVVNQSDWNKRSASVMSKTYYAETVRGRILDAKGREIAVDLPCIDACVDYRAIMREAEPRWLREQALARVRTKLGDQYSKTSRTEIRKLIESEKLATQADIDAMWIKLAQIYRRQLKNSIEPQTAIDAVEDIRQSIESRVEMRQRYIWYTTYAEAQKRFQEQGPIPWYRQLASGSSGNAPRIDSFQVEVSELTEAHVVLRAISSDDASELGKDLARLPGLSLQPSKHRVYPYNDAGCHLMGHVSRVNDAELVRDREEQSQDPSKELRKYWPNDLIGRGGLEGLFEEQLRGARGRSIKNVVEQTTDTTPAEPGKDVASSIDIELQKEVQDMFAKVPVVKDTQNGVDVLDVRPMHGAAVVIDVPTGEVRVLASYPTFDANRFDELFSSMINDDYNQPMLNRATRQAVEPGSTVKPIVGIGAITSGVMRGDEGVECTGYLVLNGRRVTTAPRCWVLSMFGERLKSLGISPEHHPIPENDASPGKTLDFAEGLERSCNIFFETAADRLGIDGLSNWFGKFGLGKRTGIGIAESPGRTPGSYKGANRALTTWAAGIGQGHMAATPLQMANVAATIARDGVWMRPSLQKDTQRGGDEVIDLKIDPAAMAGAKKGMYLVANKLAGSGFKYLRNLPVPVAAKSGSAQAARFSVPQRDPQGKIILDERGRPKRQLITPSTFEKNNPDAPWYLARGREDKPEFTHSWFIGYAPADKPQVAFAVLVEYAGGGGSAASPMARQILEACIKHGYLQKR